MSHLSVEDYQETRDKKFILNAFEQYWNFLVDVSIWSKFSEEIVLEDLFAENREIKILAKFEEPVGFIVYRPNKPNKYFFYSDPKSISILYVDPLYRGQGYANMLIKYAIKDMITDNKTNEVTAVINEDNIPSIKAFKKAGFQISKIVPRPQNLSSHIHMFIQVFYSYN